MTIEEAKAKLSKAYYLIEEVSDAIGRGLELAKQELAKYKGDL